MLKSSDLSQNAYSNNKWIKNYSIIGKTPVFDQSYLIQTVRNNVEESFTKKAVQEILAENILDPFLKFVEGLQQTTPVMFCCHRAFDSMKFLCDLAVSKNIWEKFHMKCRNILCDFKNFFTIFNIFFLGQKCDKGAKIKKPDSTSGWFQMVFSRQIFIKWYDMVRFSCCVAQEKSWIDVEYSLWAGKKRALND